MGSVGRPWHEEYPDEFASVRSNLDREFPYLFVVVQEGRSVLKGEFPVVFDGSVVDVFEIEVVIPPGGLRSEVPVVREVGGRIPHFADRHVYANGKACLFVEAEYWYRFPEGMDLIEFVQGPVTSYFVGQFVYEQTGKWPFGERSHGTAGIIEFYASHIGTDDLQSIQHLLGLIAAGSLNGRARCPCGSGRRLNACHVDLLRDLRSSIPRSVAGSDLARLSTQLIQQV